MAAIIGIHCRISVKVRGKTLKQKDLRERVKARAAAVIVLMRPSVLTETRN